MLQAPLDPLKSVQEIAVLACMLIALVFLWRFRENVLLALTGDTHIHANTLDCIWGTIRCGGLCNGEWTRHITCCPLFSHCCCFGDLRNTNLVKEFGKAVGLSYHDVEIKNLTVGDLPFRSQGDFYLTVQCASNPDQVTSIAVSQNPKIVHFPEVLTLRMRASWLENNVKFTVRELNVLGSKELCELSLSAQAVLDWSKHKPGEKDDMRMKRFEMRVLNGSSFEAETQPWIFLEIDEAHEARQLENLQETSTVRTMDATGTQGEGVPLLHFKNEYNLVDATGSAVQEPREEDLAYIRRLRFWLVFFFHLINIVVTLTVVGFCGARFYMWSCYTQYKHLTMARMNGVDFPISLYKLNELVDECNDRFKGTGQPAGIPCRPTDDQIEETCRVPPEKQPPVGAGKMLAHKLFDAQITGIQCSGVYDGWDVCQWRNHIEPWDLEIFLGLFALMISTIFLRTVLNGCIRAYKGKLQREHANKLADARDKMFKTGK